MNLARHFQDGIFLRLLQVLPLVALLASGCRLVQGVADVPSQAVRTVTPGAKSKTAVDPVEVQNRLMRFGDEFSSAMIAGVEKLRRGTNAISPAETVKWKLVFASETTSIASGPNALANLLDMSVFVTVARITLEDYWQPKVFGESTVPMLESARQFESQIWVLSSTVLKPEQQTELREAILAWRQSHPMPESLLGARAVGFAEQVAVKRRASGPAPATGTGVFALLGLDPLAGLDPATREIAQTRLFAERALYIAQWMPTLMRWQAELLSLNAVALPEVQQMITNSTEIAASVERFARVAEQLPGQLSAERQEVIKALEAQEKTLTPLVNEVRQTLTAGSQMSSSLNTTLITFDALMQRFGVGDTNAAETPATNSEPFRIADYGDTAMKLQAAARQLNELLLTADQTLGSTNLTQLAAQVSPVVQQAQAGGKEVVDYAFWKGILLIVVLLVAALIYRFASSRMKPANHSKPTSP